MAERKFKDITADFYKFEKIGDVLEGTLVSKDSQGFTRAGQTNDVGKYVLENEAGERISFLGGTVIDQTLSDVNVGSYVRLTFLGTKPTTQGQNLKDFTIELAV
jgi:hypothetical protein